MLHPAQDGPCVAKASHLRVGHETEGAQAEYGGQRARHLEARVPPAPHQLQRLNEKLRLADPTGPKLHVVGVGVAMFLPRAREHVGEVECDRRIDAPREHERP
jgi:hypothetical protein